MENPDTHSYKNPDQHSNKNPDPHKRDNTKILISLYCNTGTGTYAWIGSRSILNAIGIFCTTAESLQQKWWVWKDPFLCLTPQ